MQSSNRSQAHTPTPDQNPFMHVGQVVVTVDGFDSRLEQGDAMYFDPAFLTVTARRVGRFSVPWW